MSPNMNTFLAALQNQPVLMSPDCADQLTANLNAVMSHPRLGDMMESASSEDGFWPAADDWRAAYRPYVIKDGILHIPVKGVLLHDFPWALGGWATGYDYIERAFARGMDDTTVKAVAFVSNSPGGMVAGCFDALDKMMARKVDNAKPVWAFAQESAYSAAYATIMAADPGRINVSRTGGVGSVGVVTMHVDYSEHMKDAGVKVTFIHAGKHKVDGNPYEPLPDEVKARIQSRIDEMYGIFVSAVARGRNMSEEDVRATEAQCFTATEALSNGLVDHVGTLDDALAAFAVELSTNDGDEPMSNNQDSSAALSAENNAPDAATIAASAVTAERSRISAITRHESAKVFSNVAQVATDEGMDADLAVKVLAAAALDLATHVPEAPESDGDGEENGDGANAETPFEKAMKNGNPDIGASNSGTDDKDEDGSQTIALARKMGIVGVRPAAK